jgi:hypothetical protein
MRICKKEFLEELNTVSKLNDLSSELDFYTQLKDHLKNCIENQYKYIEAQKFTASIYIERLKNKEKMVSELLKSTCIERTQVLISTFKEMDYD